MKEPILWIKWNDSDNNWLASDTFEDYKQNLIKAGIVLFTKDGYYMLDKSCPVGELILALINGGVNQEEIAVYV